MATDLRPRPHPRERTTYALLAGQYATQFLGGSFLATSLPAILRGAGVGLAQLAVLPLVMIIPIARVLWAPLVDHVVTRTGRYRPWLLVLQPALAVTLLGLLLLDPVTDLGLVLVVMVLVALISSTKDIAVDALAIRALSRSGRGVAGGLQSAGGNIGGLVGGGLVVVVHDHLGWAPAVLVLAGCVALPVWQVLRYAEPARPVADPPTAAQSLSAAAALLRDPQARRWALVVAPVLWLGVGTTYGLLVPMLVDTGWSLSRIGLTVNGLGSAVAIVGALALGALTGRLGLRRMLHGAAALQVLALLMLLPLAGGTASTATATFAVCLLVLTFAVVATTAAATAMELCRTTTAGGDFAALGAVALATSFASGALGLTLAGAVGYVPVVVGAALVAAVSQVALRWFWSAGRRSTVLGEEAGEQVREQLGLVLRDQRG